MVELAGEGQWLLALPRHLNSTLNALQLHFIPSGGLETCINCMQTF